MVDLSLFLVVFSVPWENAVVLPGLGTISRVLGLSALFIGFVTILQRGTIRRLGNAHWAMIFFVAWSGVTYFWSQNDVAAIVKFLTMLQLLGFALLISQFHHERLNLGRAYVFGGFVASLLVFIEYMGTGSSSLQRVTAPGFNPNDLAVTLAMGVPLAWSTSFECRSAIATWFYRSYLPVATVAILITASRGALFALAAALMIVLWTVKGMNWTRKLGLVVVISALLLGGAFLAPTTSLTRLATIQSELVGGDLNHRRVIWAAGITLVEEHPVLGVGLGAFPRAVARYINDEYVAHNTFLSILAEQGFIGFLIFVMLLGSVICAVMKLPDHTRLAMIFMLLCWTIGALSLTWETTKPTWVMFALIAALAASERLDLVTQTDDHAVSDI